ncbi:MAG: hypothetical protein M1826_007573 [Phylliscum demangeonii]|nr:MAG: hypothetical protein M1826_007573 [Phylliscum demangeonii]
MPVVPETMNTYDGRLASFTAARLTKRRGSSAKVAKTVSWPRSTPSPAQLAEAGFYYTPTASSLDNVTCFMCQKNLDGWEEEDDPALEHLHHSNDCGWAVIACVKGALNDQKQNPEDPRSQRMQAARRATFADRWPHEGKKGWTCKVEKMVEGGWYYCPTAESDDFVSCPYCNLALDGWEPKDKPVEEHRRRSPDCPFVELVDQASNPAKKSRTSKASRASNQSSIVILSREPSIEDLAVQDGDRALTAAADVSMATTGTKKGGRAKKVTTKSKVRKIKTKTVELVQVEQVEVEDLEVETELQLEEPAKATRGRKRKSSELGLNGSIDHAADVDGQPPKRRATRTRSSTIQQIAASASETLTTVLDQSTTIATLDELKPKKGRKRAGSQASVVEPIAIDDDVSTAVQEIVAEDRDDEETGRKKGRQRAPSKSRASAARASKRLVSSASTASRASNASLRPEELPNDNDLEQALEADFDRPLTDDEAEGPVIASHRRSGRTRSIAPRKVSACVVAIPRKASGRRAKASNSTALEASLPVAPPPSSPFDDDPAPVQAPRRPLAITAPRTTAGEASTPGDVALAELDHDDHDVNGNALPAPPVEQQHHTTPSPSPQSSDAENHPPSSRPTLQSATKPSQPSRRPLPMTMPMTTSTPLMSPSPKRHPVPLPLPAPDSNDRRRHGAVPAPPPAWTAADLEAIFIRTPLGGRSHDDGEGDDDDDGDDDEDGDDDAVDGMPGRLTSQEEAMTVEEWVLYNARLGEDRLRRECERMIGRFEMEGNRALQLLERMPAV